MLSVNQNAEIFVFIIRSEMCCSSHSYWDFNWHKFKDIYCTFLELLFSPMRSSRRAVLILSRWFSGFPETAEKFSL